MKKQRNTKVKVILIIVGSQDVASINFEKHLREIPGNHDSTAISAKSAVLGRSNILRRVPDLQGIW